MSLSNKHRACWLSWLVYILFFLVVMQAANWWKTQDAASGNLSEFSGKLINGTSFTIDARYQW